MKIKYLKYLSAYIVPIIVSFSLIKGGIWSYTAIVVLFVFIPTIELFTTSSPRNMDAVEEAIAENDRVYDYLLYGLVPIQFIILVYFLIRVGDDQLLLYEIIGMITAFGMACGISINNAHELGHRTTGYERFMSKSLLMTSLYMHFYIEHNRGHHKRVATEEDPASSRYGESVYSFYVRSLVGSWLSAWKLEEKRLKNINRPIWSLDNEMLRFQIIQLVLLLIILWLTSWKVLLCFVFSATIGFLLLETVNYIEHYGLRRKKNDMGYERTEPIHSWNSNHPLGRMILLELSRHSDHHYRSTRKYQILRHFDGSPQMPYGYPAMMLLSLVPPLWFRIMHRKIVQYKAGAHGKALV